MMGMSDLNQINEKLRAKGLPKIVVCHDLTAGRFLMLTPAFAQEVADEIDARRRRELDYRDVVTEDRLAEEIARTSSYTLHVARGLIIEFFGAGGSVRLFDELASISKEKGFSLPDFLQTVIRVMRLPATPSGSESDS
jgi:hypothetical protein